MDIAGVVLGAIPIAIWAIEKSQEPLETWTKYNIALNSLKSQLALEKFGLQQTLEEMGLRGLAPDQAHERLLVKFPSMHKSIIFIIQEMEGLLSNLLEELDIDIKTKPAWMDAPSERADWEGRRFKRSIKTKKLKEIIKELSMRNASLRRLVGMVEVPTLGMTGDRGDNGGNGGIQRLNTIRMRYNELACNAVRDQARSLFRTVEAGIATCAEDRHEATIELDWDAVPRFTVSLLHKQHDDGDGLEHTWKAFHASGQDYSQDSNGRQTGTLAAPLLSEPLRPPSQPSLRSQSRSSSRSPSLWRSKVKEVIKSRFHRTSRTSVTFTVPDVAVQKAQQTPTLSETSSITTMTATVSSSPEITNLCTGVPSISNASDPFATIRDPHTAGSSRTFSLSHTTLEKTTTIRPVYLKRAVPDEKRYADGLLALPPGQRWALAAAVAQAVLYLSNSDWLDDGWISDQVGHFQHIDPSFRRELLSKYAHIFRTFDRSASFLDEASRSRHSPTAPFIRNKTIFALGIFLIELGVNEAFQDSSLDAILQGTYPDLDEKLKKVSLEAGDLYHFAVYTCIRCDFVGCSSGMDLEIPMFRWHFHESVVAPLQAAAEVASPSYRPL